MVNITKNSKQEQSVIVAQAETYRMYVRGCAYIPLQDLARYEKAHKAVYGKDII